MLDLKRLQYLDAVYTYKNFTRASEALFVSQSTISNAISALEAEYGIKLMFRNSKSVVFTEEGELFMTRVKELLALSNATEKVIKDLSDQSQQNLCVGISYTLSSRIVPLIYSEFLPAHPRASFHLEEGSMSRQIELLLGEQLDLIYNAFPDRPDPEVFQTIPITTSEIHVVLQPCHPLAKLDRVPIERLAREPLVMMDPQSKVNALMSQAFSRRRIKPNIMAYYDQLLSMVNLVDNCGYVGVLSVEAGVHVQDCENLIILPLDDPIVFNVGITLKAGSYLSRLGQDLIGYIRSKALVPIGDR